jgi:RecA-family ATPase
MNINKNTTNAELDAEVVRLDQDKTAPSRKSNGSTKAAPPPLALSFFDDLAGNFPPKVWVIKGVIARGETSSWVAPPGKGKSALLTDISVHAAGGLNWCEYRTKERCGVLYIALERADLVKRRLAAYAMRGHSNLPIAVAAQIVNLMARDCAEVIVATIRAAENKFGCAVGLVIIDTYAKGIAAGGGDEDKAKDQNVVLANLRRIHEQASVHIAIVGHTGKDETRGARGSNAHLADTDLMVQIAGDAIKVATVIKGNDQPEGALVKFKLESFMLGHDEDGDELHVNRNSGRPQ